MWHDPARLNAAANLLGAVAVALFAYAALQLLVRSPLFPLREIVIEGAPARAERVHIERALAGAGGNFFAVDLAALRARLEQVPWVRTVELRRVWPDRLVARLEEHVALARWGEHALVNTHGERFAAAIPEDEAGRLPQFAGPEGSEAEVTRRYRSFAALLRPLEAAPERVVLTPRHAWQLRLSSGLRLELGRDGSEMAEERLARFVAAWPAARRLLAERAVPEPRQADLRYPNGFAVRVTGWSN